MLLVVTHLGTAIGVWESHHIFYGSAYEALSLALNGLGNVIDAAYGGDDPDLVADADFFRPAGGNRERSVPPPAWGAVSCLL